MGFTTGVFYTPMDPSDSGEAKFAHLCESHGYYPEFGDDNLDAAIEPGVVQFKPFLNWTHMALIKKPNEDATRGKDSVYGDLWNYQWKGVRPRFFDLVPDVGHWAEGNCKRLLFFFTFDWEANVEVRYARGPSEDLVKMLEISGCWWLEFMDPRRGHLRQDTDFNLVFSLVLRRKNRWEPDPDS